METKPYICVFWSSCLQVQCLCHCGADRMRYCCGNRAFSQHCKGEQRRYRHGYVVLIAVIKTRPSRRNQYIINSTSRIVFLAAAVGMLLSAKHNKLLHFGFISIWTANLSWCSITLVSLGDTRKFSAAGTWTLLLRANNLRPHFVFPSKQAFPQIRWSWR